MNRISRTICSFFSITIISCLLAGCSSARPAGFADASKTVITIAARDGSHSDIIEAVKGSFEEENNCTVNVIPMSAQDIHNNSIEDSENSHGKYDIIMIDDPLMPEYVQKKVILNLTQLGYVDDNDFVEKSMLLCKDPYPLGATYALPFSGNVQLIFYNPKVITDPSRLDTWSDILAQCSEANSHGLKGYAIRGQSGNPIVSDFLPILWAFGADIYDDEGNVILDSDESREALEFYCDLYKTGDNYEKDEMVQAISEGEVGIALGWPSWFISADGVSASIAPIPGKKDHSSEILTTGEIGNWLLGVTKNSTHPELALRFIEYLTSPDVQLEAIEHGGIPTRKSIFRDADILEIYPYFAQISTGTNNSRVRPRTTMWSQIEEVFGAELFKCISGEQSVNDTITASADAIRSISE